MAGSEAEQGRPSPDIAFLQERGGLTVAHWEEVVRRIGKSKDQTDTKVVAYGQKVLTCDFPDTDNYHRWYLGYRHWDKIRSLVRPIEIRQYASLERMNQYTLDDYYHYHFSSSLALNIPYRYETGYQDPEFLVWRQDKHKWRKMRDRSEYRERVVGMDPAGHGPEPVVRELTRSWREDRTGFSTGWIGRFLLWKLLLTEGELRDPKHKSPQELLAFVKNSMPSEILNERLREFLTKEGENEGWKYHMSRDEIASFRARIRNAQLPPVNIGSWEKEVT